MRSGIGVLAAAALLEVGGICVGAQPANDPGHDLPNPYQTAVRNWAKLPDGRTWGSTAGICREAQRLARAQGLSVKLLVPLLLYPVAEGVYRKFFASVTSSDATRSGTAIPGIHPPTYTSRQSWRTKKRSLRCCPASPSERSLTHSVRPALE